MSTADMIIAKGTLKQNELNGKTVLLTGGGGGIGYEAVRALLWLGARVAIAEVDKKRGEAAEKALTAEFGTGRAFFIEADISNWKSVDKLCKQVEKKMGSIDVLFNNATIAPIGAAHEVGVAQWDKSYGVNLRGPVLLLERFLPSMLARKSGTVIFVPSSGAAPYMGAYEVFKTAQVELCNTLAGELEGTGVFTFSIGPGIVKTETASKAIEKIAPLHGKTVEELFAMNAAVLISAEEAGAGFAAAVAMADRYNGAETSSLQSLTDAGISLSSGLEQKFSLAALSNETGEHLKVAFATVLKTFREQSAGWMSRNVFERQWVMRDFKKETGLSIDLMTEELRKYESNLAGNKLPASRFKDLVLGKIRGYYIHQKEMMMSYEKDRSKAGINASIIDGWITEISDMERIYPDSKRGLV